MNQDTEEDLQKHISAKRAEKVNTRGEKKYPIEFVHVLEGETFIHYTNKCEVAPGRWGDCKSLAIISDYGTNASLISGGDLAPPLIWVEKYYK